MCILFLVGDGERGNLNLYKQYACRETVSFPYAQYPRMQLVHWQ